MVTIFKRKVILGEEAVAILARLIAEGVEYGEYRVLATRSFWELRCTEAEDLIIRAEYYRLVREITRLWGKPDFAGTWEDEGFPEWSNMIEMQYWHRENATAFVAWSHQDKELSMEVLLGTRSEDSTPASQ